MGQSSSTHFLRSSRRNKILVRKSAEYHGARFQSSFETPTNPYYGCLSQRMGSHSGLWRPSKNDLWKVRRFRRSSHKSLGTSGNRKRKPALRQRNRQQDVAATNKQYFVASKTTKCTTLLLKVGQKNDFLSTHL